MDPTSYDFRSSFTAAPKWSAAYAMDWQAMTFDQVSKQRQSNQQHMQQTQQGMTTGGSMQRIDDIIHDTSFQQQIAAAQKNFR